MTPEPARPSCTIDPQTGNPAKGRPAVPIIKRERLPSEDFEARNLGVLSLGQFSNLLTYKTGLPAERVMADGFFNRANVKAGDLIYVVGEVPFFLSVAGRVAKEKNGITWSDVVTVQPGLATEAKSGIFGLGRKRG